VVVADQREGIEPKTMARPAGSPSPLRIGELLVRRALIDPNDLALALSEQELSTGSAPLGRLLVRLGAIDEDDLTVTLAEQSGMRVVDLDRDPPPESSVLSRITREAAFRLQALPLRYEEGGLVIALAEPPSRDVRREILKLSGRQADFVLANARLLADAIERWYPHPSLVNAAPPAGADTTIDLQLRRTVTPSLHFQSNGRVDIAGVHGTSAIAPASDRVVAWLLAHAADVGASAIHLVEEPPDLRVRVSVNGRMRDTTVLPAATGDILVRRVLRAVGLDADAAVAVAQSGRLSSAEPGFGPRVRVTTMPTGPGRTIVCAVERPAVSS
jgi:type II secretory ATPase GspE/PulE/Tfp pilus assembly ATPase PilB-like protein